MSTTQAVDVDGAWSLLRGGQHAAARDAFAALFCHSPEPRVRLGLAEAHLRLGEPVAAENCLRQGGGELPVDLRVELGFALQSQGRWPEAEAEYGAVLAAGHDHARARLGLGVVLMKQCRMAEAQAVLERHLELCPADAHAWAHLASIHRSFGRMSQAFIAYRNALRTLPDDDPVAISSHCELALTALSIGDYATGFEELEWRLQALMAEHLAVMRSIAPSWEGVVAKGRRLLLWYEQGLGDVIHFARYAQVLGEWGMQVHLWVPPGLARLVRTIPNVHAVYVAGDAIPPVDCQAALMSVPHLLRRGGRGLSIPRKVPYIYPDPAEIAVWRDRIDSVAAGRRRVGLVWAGNPGFGLDHRRTLELDVLAPVLAVPGNAFFSLQVGGGRLPADRLAAAGVSDLADHLGDYADTAAAMSALDLIISVDTSTVHCAGALARPAWLPLYTPPDWRWGLTGEETIWYPTIRLFRQTVQGIWDDVVERMAVALRDRQGP